MNRGSYPKVVENKEDTAKSLNSIQIKNVFEEHSILHRMKIFLPLHE